MLYLGFSLYMGIMLYVCFVIDCQRGSLLGSKELGTNVLELHFELLVNHDQNVLVLFRLAQSMCFFM